ncbi:MAG: hypothetical protein WCI57_03740 [Candidatus Berkelbacteria bacterium]
MKKTVQILLVAVALLLPIATMSQIGTPSSDARGETWEGQGIGTPQNVAHRGLPGKTGKDGIGRPYAVRSTEIVTVTVETQGAKGDKGDSGQNGIDGLPGPRGADGISIKGDPGENGIDGRDGKNGQNGANGLRGPRGTQGRNGRDAVVRHKVVFDDKRWNEYLRRESAQDGRITKLSGKITTVAKTAKADDQKMRREAALAFVSIDSFKKDKKEDSANFIGLIVFLAFALIVLALVKARSNRRTP